MKIKLDYSYFTGILNRMNQYFYSFDTYIDSSVFMK